MNKAHELLRRALEDLDAFYGEGGSFFADEIRTYLANQETAKDEPVAWTNQDELNALGTDVTCYMYSEHDVLEDSIPLYLHPAKPERKPMTEEPIAYINLDEQRLEFAVPFQFNRSAFKQGKIPLYTRPEPEAEPVRYMVVNEQGETSFLYTRPAAPERKPMTEEEMRDLFKKDLCGDGDVAFFTFRHGIRYAEKHHGILGEPK
jgi:hypothetical protein